MVNHHHHHHEGEEFTLFVFVDQALALQGYISLKAYRLTQAALDNLKSEDYFSPDRYYRMTRKHRLAI